MFYKVAAGVGVAALVAIAGVMGWQAWQGAKLQPIEFCSINDRPCGMKWRWGQ